MFEFRRVAAGELDDLYAAHAEPDMELHLPVAYPDVEDLVGLAGLKELFRMFQEIWEEWRQEPEAWARQGDTVVVLTTLVARGKGSGAEIATPAAHVWTLADERVKRVEVQPDRDAALHEAGLNPGDLRPWP